MPVKYDSQRRATAKYNSQNYDSLLIRLPNGKKEVIQALAEKRGESVNGFVNRAIDNEIVIASGKGDVVEMYEDFEKDLRRLRRIARKQGFQILRGKIGTPYEGFDIADSNDVILTGGDFTMDLDAVEKWLTEKD